MTVEVVLRDGAVYEVPRWERAGDLREQMGLFTRNAWIIGFGPLYHEGRGEAWLRASEVVVIRERS